MREWEKNVRQVVPYVPGEQPKVSGLVKLNTNENPYPPAPGVKTAIEQFQVDNLKLYPEATAGTLVSELARAYGVNENQVFAGVGSDDVLAVAFLTFFNSEKPILFPDISYTFYPVWAELYRIPFVKIPLDQEFRIQSEDYRRENGGIIFPNPNAPTAIYEPLDRIEEIVKQNQDSVVIIDEAYIDFGGTSALALTERYDNLLVVQTFSKSRSMAGIRIGFAIGSPALIKAMNDVKYSINSYTLNQTSIALGVEALKDNGYFEQTLNKIIATRENTSKELAKLGFHCTDSKANFLFVSHETCPAKEIYEYLRSKNIFVRYFNLPRIDNYLRITVGTDDEMNILCNALQQYITEQ